MKDPASAAPPTDPHTGGCLCGAVRFELDGALRDVVICHCRMCRKVHGHVGAYTASRRDALTFAERRGLRWYRYSAEVCRGFCVECGATLFWDKDGCDSISIAAGALDPPTGVRTALQIHVTNAGDYYDVDPSIPIRAE